MINPITYPKNMPTRNRPADRYSPRRIPAPTPIDLTGEREHYPALPGAWNLDYRSRRNGCREAINGIVTLRRHRGGTPDLRVTLHIEYDCLRILPVGMPHHLEVLGPDPRGIYWLDVMHGDRIRLGMVEDHPQAWRVQRARDAYMRRLNTNTIDEVA